MRRTLVVAATGIIGAAALFGGRAFAQKGEIPPWMRITLTAPGAPRDTHPEADDQGPPEEVKERLFYSTGANLKVIGISWGECEKQQPADPANRTFDFSKLEEKLRRIPERMWVKVHIGLGCSWAEKLKERNEDLYWRLAEDFITEAARFARKVCPKAIYYGTPGNEPSLTMKPDWAFRHMGPVKHYYRAIKKASPDNQVFVGALVVGDRARVEALYAAGLKNNFDVLDIHAYDDTGGKTFVSVNQIVESHQVLVEHGDGDKMIFLGEGWSCFPLPESIDRREQKRYEKGLGHSLEPYDYTPEEIEHYRQSVLRGWRALTTPRPGFYDPHWTLGASYFTMNDFWGSMHWKERAIPHYDANGNIEWWDLDGYYVPYAPFALEPKYRPWGLVDANGKPKGDIIFNFPPYLPKVEITGEINAPIVDGSRTAAAGEPYVVTIRVRNLEPEGITDCRFDMGMRNERDLKMRFRDITGTPAPRTLGYNRAVVRRFEVIAPPDAVGKRLQTSGELYYNWRGRPYYYDAWIDFNVIARASATLQRDVAVIERRGGEASFHVTVRNIQSRPFQTELVAAPSKGLRIRPARVKVALGPNTEKTYSFKAALEPTAAPGVYDFTVKTGPALPDLTSNIAFTDGPVTPAKPGVLINGSFEEFGPDTGFNGWEGARNNWQVGDALDDLPGGGKRCFVIAWNGTKYATSVKQYVELADPERDWGKKVRISAMFKGLGFEGGKPEQTRCRLVMHFRGKDDAGGVGDETSPTFTGTGRWQRIEHVFGPIPKGCYGLRVEVVLENIEYNGWHIGYVDLVDMKMGR